MSPGNATGSCPLFKTIDAGSIPAIPQAADRLRPWITAAFAIDHFDENAPLCSYAGAGRVFDFAP